MSMQLFLGSATVSKKGRSLLTHVPCTFPFPAGSNHEDPTVAHLLSMLAPHGWEQNHHGHKSLQ